MANEKSIPLSTTSVFDMDFVKKKAFEAKLNKVGKDLGLSSGNNPFGGSSRRNDNSNWNVFGQSNAGADEPEGDAEMEVLPVAVASSFDNKPKNFPMFIHLFYVNRGILSEEAKGPVNWAYGNFIAVEGLLLFNLFVAILLTALRKGEGWVNLLLSVVVGLLVSVFELISYETAFRGAYRTSTNLRQRFLYFGAANIIIITVYMATGKAFFNGWSRVTGLAAVEGKEKYKTVQLWLSVVESIGWSATLFLTSYTLFEYYHLLKARSQGLTQRELAAARGEDVPEAAFGENNGRAASRGDRGRVQEIRDRYNM